MQYMYTGIINMNSLETVHKRDDTSRLYHTVQNDFPTLYDKKGPSNLFAVQGDVTARVWMAIKRAHLE